MFISLGNWLNSYLIIFSTSFERILITVCGSYLYSLEIMKETFQRQRVLESHSSLKIQFHLITWVDPRSKSKVYYHLFNELANSRKAYKSRNIFWVKLLCLSKTSKPICFNSPLNKKPWLVKFQTGICRNILNEFCQKTFILNLKVEFFCFRSRTK